MKSIILITIASLLSGCTALNAVAAIDFYTGQVLRASAPSPYGDKGTTSSKSENTHVPNSAASQEEIK